MQHPNNDLCSSDDSFTDILQDYRINWPACERVLMTRPEYLIFLELFGKRKAKTQFTNKIAQLRHDFITKRKAELLRRIPGLLEEFFPTLGAIGNR